MSGVDPVNMVPLDYTKTHRGKRLIAPKFSSNNDGRFSNVF